MKILTAILLLGLTFCTGYNPPKDLEDVVDVALSESMRERFQEMEHKLILRPYLPEPLIEEEEDPDTSTNKLMILTHFSQVEFWRLDLVVEELEPANQLAEAASKISLHSSHQFQLPLPAMKESNNPRSPPPPSSQTDFTTKNRAAVTASLDPFRPVIVNLVAQVILFHDDCHV